MCLLKVNIKSDFPIILYNNITHNMQMCKTF